VEIDLGVHQACCGVEANHVVSCENVCPDLPIDILKFVDVIEFATGRQHNIELTFRIKCASIIFKYS